MDRETVVSFFVRLLESCRVPSRRYAPGEAIASDKGLCDVLGADPLSQLAAGDSVQPNTIYDLTDSLSWCYHLMRLPHTGELLLIGPYLREAVGDEALMDIMERSAIPPSSLPLLRGLYRQLTVSPGENMFYTAMNTLGEALWGADQFTIERRSLELLDTFKAPDAAVLNTYREAVDARRIERSYQGETELMYAVAHGKIRRANAILDQFSISMMEQRSAVPLRNMKNYLIILNTLMRKAVQQGGVHPLYIDRVSSAIAHRIEQCPSLEQCYALMRDMIRKYCLLVKNHNMTQYSQTVQSVILQIDAELTGDLSLKAHAQRLHVNASYLSALFRRETGQTLTAFVSERRVSYAVYLLNTTDMQIQTIAQHCGFPDMNYFSRTFKKIIGRTPSQYRETVRSGAQAD